MSRARIAARRRRALPRDRAARPSCGSGESALRAQLLAALLAWVACVWSPRAAQAQSAAPAATSRVARLQWDATKQWLLVSVSFRDVASPSVIRNLRLGLPTTIVMTGLLFAVGGERALATTVQSCKVTWHVWEEVYRVEVTRTGQKGVRHSVTPTLNGVLRRCAEADRLVVAGGSQVPTAVPLSVRAKVLVNPVSPDLLQRIKGWVSRPSNTSTASPGSKLFSTFTALFMTRVGEADRVLEFATRPALPRFQAPEAGEAPAAPDPGKQ